MQLKLSENIKKRRKEMDITQEELSEALGVTVGAVSKWENGNNVPDILTLMGLANFFNISMDELVGFDMSSKKIDDMCSAIKALALAHKFDEALLMAKDAVSRYPHTYKVLIALAEVHQYRYFTTKDPEDAKLAIAAFETALKYVGSETDPDRQQYKIRSNIANLYRRIDPEKSIELLQRLNYDEDKFGLIGNVYLDMGNIPMALENYSISLIKIVSDQIATVDSMADALLRTGKRSDIKVALELMDSEIAALKAFIPQGKDEFSNKLIVLSLLLKAGAYVLLGDIPAMESTVKEAYNIASELKDNYSEADYHSFLRYNYIKENKINMFDATGTNTMESLELAIRQQMEKHDRNGKPFQTVYEFWEKCRK